MIETHNAPSAPLVRAGARAEHENERLGAHKSKSRNLRAKLALAMDDAEECARSNAAGERPAVCTSACAEREPERLGARKAKLRDVRADLALAMDDVEACARRNAAGERPVVEPCGKALGGGTRDDGDAWVAR